MNIWQKLSEINTDDNVGLTMNFVKLSTRFLLYSKLSVKIFYSAVSKILICQCDLYLLATLKVQTQC